MKCPLCGGEYHPSPDTKQDQFGLICPGPEAEQDLQDIYVALITQAYLNQLTDEAQAYVDEVAKRRELWYARERTDVTQEELQADCDVRVAEKLPDDSTGQIEATMAEFDIDPPHLTIPGKIYRGMRSLRKGGDKTKEDDAMLFVDPPQASQPGPPDPPHIPPNDGYYNH